MVSILDKNFETFIQADEIANEVKSLARKISEDYAGKEVLFLSILNGAFMFAADLYRNISLPSQISFVKVQSYAGMESTGRVDEVIGLTEDIKGKELVIIEDIVDSGITIEKVKKLLSKGGPSSISVCTLLFKPDAFQGQQKPEYIGFAIPNKFVVGYGLDYNGYGRNLEEICQLKTGE